MKIALVHDLLVKLGGAEKVLEKLSEMYPKADIFTLIYDEKKVGKVFPKESIKYIPSSTQNIYNLFWNQRFCLPFMAKAVESIDLSEYDIVIADSSAFAHWVITKPETKFVVYYHTPTRYLWDWTNEYKKDIGWNTWLKGMILNGIFKKLRIWDVIASQRHEITLANSHNVAKRLKKYYWLDAKVIYPNVDTHQFERELPSEFQSKIPFKKYYLIISALSEFKKVDLAIKAFAKMPDKNLVIVGSGNYQETLKKMAGKNVYFTGRIDGDEFLYAMLNTLWVIFPGEEDFGIVPIEAFSAGKPVFAYKWWGLAETMVEWVTGAFFENKNGDDFVENFEKFEKNIFWKKYTSESIKNVAKKYSESEFERQIREVIWF